VRRLRLGTGGHVCQWESGDISPHSKMKRRSDDDERYWWWPCHVKWLANPCNGQKITDHAGAGRRQEIKPGTAGK